MIIRQREPTVFVVDDDEAVRNSLRLLLKSMGMPVITHRSAEEFLARYDPDQSDCIVLDVRMPGMSGPELQEELNRRGAIDFLQKPFSDKELTDRIQRALAADRRNRDLLGEKEQICTRLAMLTRREKQVLELVTRGKSNKVIAGDLGLSQRTVEIHRAHVTEKMGATSIAHLVRMTIIADIGISTY